MLKHCKRIFSSFLISIMITVFLGLTAPKPVFASVHLDFSIPKKAYQALSDKISNKHLIAKAEKLLITKPEMFCQVYADHSSDLDSLAWKTVKTGITSTATVSGAIASASAAGAGSLADYAGIAAAVSQLGLGGATTAIAGMMGSSATGAAATAVVTSAVGGPLVMGALLIGGTTATTYGTYKLGKFAFNRLGNLTERYCSSK